MMMLSLSLVVFSFIAGCFSGGVSERAQVPPLPPVPPLPSAVGAGEYSQCSLCNGDLQTLLDNALKQLHIVQDRIKQCCSPKCPKGYFHLSNRCYKVVEKRSSWTKAWKSCANDRASLLAIETKDEERALNEYFTKNIDKYEIPLRFYTSGNDIEKPGYWSWGVGSSAIPLSYKNFIQDEEPHKKRSDKEDCMEYIANYGWNDLPCFVPSKYICEMPALPNTVEKTKGDGVVDKAEKEEETLEELMEESALGTVAKDNKQALLNSNPDKSNVARDSFNLDRLETDLVDKERPAGNEASPSKVKAPSSFTDLADLVNGYPEPEVPAEQIPEQIPSPNVNTDNVIKPVIQPVPDHHRAAQSLPGGLLHSRTMTNANSIFDLDREPTSNNLPGTLTPVQKMEPNAQLPAVASLESFSMPNSLPKSSHQVPQGKEAGAINKQPIEMDPAYSLFEFMKETQQEMNRHRQSIMRGVHYTSSSEVNSVKKGTKVQETTNIIKEDSTLLVSNENKQNDKPARKSANEKKMSDKPIQKSAEKPKDEIPETGSGGGDWQSVDNGRKDILEYIESGSGSGSGDDSGSISGSGDDGGSGSGSGDGQEDVKTRPVSYKVKPALAKAPSTLKNIKPLLTGARPLTGSKPAMTGQGQRWVGARPQNGQTFPQLMDDTELLGLFDSINPNQGPVQTMEEQLLAGISGKGDNQQRQSVPQGQNVPKSQTMEEQLLAGLSGKGQNQQRQSVPQEQNIPKSDSQKPMSKITAAIVSKNTATAKK